MNISLMPRDERTDIQREQRCGQVQARAGTPALSAIRRAALVTDPKTALKL
jgi:hypothetical protein